MAKLKLPKNVKGLMTQRVRMGLFTVPVWLMGLVFLIKYLRDRRRPALVA